MMTNVYCVCMLVVSFPPGEAEEGEGAGLRRRPSRLRQAPGLRVPQVYKRHLHSTDDSCGKLSTCQSSFIKKYL